MQKSPGERRTELQTTMKHIALSYIALLSTILSPVLLRAQLAPEIGYVLPAGGQTGTTVDVKIGGYDWTPDTQIFVHDPRVKLEIAGPPSGVLVPDPPYWFGGKARGNDRPLPREFPARLTIAADVPPGLVRFQVANANGASPPGFIAVGSLAEVTEEQERKSPQVLPQLPVLVNGRIQRIEEIDRYEFAATQSGPVTIELLARRLGSPLHGLLKVTDDTGKVVVDEADTQGRDLAATFTAQAGGKYQLSLHDLDFAGDRSYVYRLAITPGPRVQAAYPAAGRPGETKEVEFIGPGLASGGEQLESLKQSVAFPATPDVASFHYVLETPHGKALPFLLGLSQLPELVRPAGSAEMPLPQLPCAVTSSLATRFGSDRYQAAMTKDEQWRITAQAHSLQSPLDLELVLLDAAGKEVARADDSPGTTDPTLTFTPPADGTYTVLLTDLSGASGTREANYRLVIEPLVEDFAVTAPTQLATPLGTPAKLAIKVERQGSFKGAVQLKLAGLPTGVTAPADLAIAEGASDLAIDLASQADAACAASLVTVTATGKIGEQMVSRSSSPILIATIMKPRLKITPEGLDDVRKVRRGSTYLAPVFVDRLEGYQGEVVLEMTAQQQRHRQGLASEEFTVPADGRRVEYPIFLPEWMETTKTSRMILNGAVKVADPQGNVRTLLQKQELRIGILPEGALLKLGSGQKEITGQPGDEIEIPLTLFRAPELVESVRLELVPPELPEGLIAAEPLTLEAAAAGANLKLRLADDARLVGERSLVFRATALQDGRWPVVSETTVLLITAAK